MHEQASADGKTTMAENSILPLHNWVNITKAIRLKRYSIWANHGQHWVRKEASHTSPVVLWRMRAIPDRGKEWRILCKSLSRQQYFYLKYGNKIKELNKDHPWFMMTSIFPFRNRTCPANGWVRIIQHSSNEARIFKSSSKVYKPRLLHSTEEATDTYHTKETTWLRKLSNSKGTFELVGKWLGEVSGNCRR